MEVNARTCVPAKDVVDKSKHFQLKLLNNFAVNALLDGIKMHVPDSGHTWDLLEGSIVDHPQLPVDENEKIRRFGQCAASPLDALDESMDGQAHKCLADSLHLIARNMVFILTQDEEPTPHHIRFHLDEVQYNEDDPDVPLTFVVSMFVSPIVQA